MENNKTDLTYELGQNFIDYAVAVNTDRSIPDAKTGLKPVAKRILYGAYYCGFGSGKPHVKCANIVGNVMADWHPHGDTSIYGALTRLAQDWVMRYPLIDWHGNKGNRDGDEAANQRYTEARLAKITEDGLLVGMKKDIVDYIPNYSETKDEPVTLPSLFPNLLCNPNQGIGVAMACNWAPHNLVEVAQAIYDYMDGKEPILPGPDFPTGGLVINKNDIPAIMRTGHGSVKIRGKYNVEDNNIVFYEIPYGVVTEPLITQIGTLCDDGTIPDVVAIRNESTLKSGFRLVIECAKGANINRIIQLLFKHTDLQSSFAYNQVALVGKTPTELNLKQCIKIYIEHNVDCIKREAKFDIDKAQKRLEVIEGLIKALEDIDNIIALIKKSESSSAAKENLIKTYQFTEPQAKAIIDMRLGKLAHLETVELNEEKAGCLSEIEHLNSILTNPQKELRTRLENLVKKYGDTRRTELAQIDINPKEEKEIEYVEPEKCIVVMTDAGTVKRVPTVSFRTQKRAGKGVKTQEDITSAVIRTNTIDSLMIFSNQGKMYRLLVNDIPVGTNVSKGTAIKSLVPMEMGEEPATMYSIYRDTPAKYVLFITKNGIVKKTSLDEYINTKKKSGIGAISLREGDSLAAVTLVKDEPLIIVTAKGYMLKFNSMEVSATSRMTVGIKGINLTENDYVVSALPVHDENDSLAIFSQNGLGKKILPNEITLQKRAGRGILAYKPNANSGLVAAATLISDDDTILVVGNKSSLCVAATDIPALGRTSLGNQMIKDNKILSVSKV